LLKQESIAALCCCAAISIADSFWCGEEFSVGLKNCITTSHSHQQIYSSDEHPFSRIIHSSNTTL
jgi:hypothetical protein